MDKNEKINKRPPKNTPKTPEALARMKRHQFGQPEANPSDVGGKQRDFYKWVEATATEKELRDYIADNSKPYVRRRFVECFLAAEKPQDYFDLTNQAHGYPKSEVQTLEKLEIEIITDIAATETQTQTQTKKKRGRKPKHVK